MQVRLFILNMQIYTHSALQIRLTVFLTDTQTANRKHPPNYHSIATIADTLSPPLLLKFGPSNFALHVVGLRLIGEILVAVDASRLPSCRPNNKMS